MFVYLVNQELAEVVTAFRELLQREPSSAKSAAAADAEDAEDGLGDGETQAQTLLENADAILKEAVAENQLLLGRAIAARAYVL